MSDDGGASPGPGPTPGSGGIDIYSEPDGDPDTLANLGPLGPLAGIWEGTGGADVHPVAGGPEGDAYVERYELQPIDRQTNAPSSSSACATTATSSNPARSRPSTTRSATGSGSRPPRR